MTHAHPQQPLPPELARLIQRLVELRSTLQETALALSDYQFTLDSAERDAAALQVQHMIERAKVGDFSAGDGH
jgi:hypothetical protein